MQDKRETKCEFCGKAYIPLKEKLKGKYIKPSAFVPNINVPDCDCLENSYQTKERERRNLQAQKKIDELARISRMGKRFLSRTFSSWKSSLANGIYNSVKQYAEEFSEMREKGQGVMMIGEPGNGKTHLSAAVFHFLRAKGFLCIYLAVSDFLDRIDYVNRESGYYISNIIDTLKTCDLIVLDDIGKEKYTETRLSTLYKLINAVYEHEIPVIVTMNFEAEEKMSSSRELKAVIDRLTEMCANYIFINKAPSYRSKFIKS